MKLYGCTGRSDRVKAAAGWAGVPLEIAPFTMGVDNKTPEFLAKNPFGKVPVLKEGDDFVLFESRAIMKYVLAGTSLCPGDAKEAARQRAEGYALYEEKPNLRRRGAEIGTWSDRERGGRRGGLPAVAWHQTTRRQPAQN